MDVANDSQSTIAESNIDDDIAGACTTGDVKCLMRLLNTAASDAAWMARYAQIATHLTPRENIVSRFMPYALPGKKTDVVACLLTFCPEYKITLMLPEALEDPDLAIIQLFYDRDPDIVTWEDGAHNTALAYALNNCNGKPDVPNFLIDHGADIYAGSLIIPPLRRAILRGFPESTITKLRLLTPNQPMPINFYIFEAIRLSRLNIALHLLHMEHFEGSETAEKTLFDAAEGAEDVKVLNALNIRRQKAKKTAIREALVCQVEQHMVELSESGQVGRLHELFDSTFAGDKHDAIPDDLPHHCPRDKCSISSKKAWL